MEVVQPPPFGQGGWLYSLFFFHFFKNLFIYFYFLYSVTCQPWRAIKIWTENLTEVPNGFLPLIEKRIT
jgi:hypothetical protein